MNSLPSRTLCLFASYFRTADLPYYVEVYLKELKKHFTDLVLITSGAKLSPASLAFLKNENIHCQQEKNEGFDFGLWYKAFQKYDPQMYSEVALVNDSCILFAGLDGFMGWARNNGADMLGMTRSESGAPHLQSYFLLVRGQAIASVKRYFETKKIIHDISQVIKSYEIGLSTHLLKEGFKIAAYIDNGGYAGEFAPYYHCLHYHLSQGIPLVKKKIIFSSYRKDELLTLARMNFNVSVPRTLQWIKKYNPELIVDFKRILQEAKNEQIKFSSARYNLLRVSISILRPFYKLFFKNRTPADHQNFNKNS